MNRRNIHIVVALLFLSGMAVYGQNLKKPVPEFTFACASATFNTFKINFKWDPPSVNSDNQFVLEMSDKNGNFDQATTLSTVANKNNDNDFDFQFSFPEETAGNGYVFRVRSTSPAKTSPVTSAYEVYYKNVNSGLVINNFEGSITVCDGTSATISINNFKDEPAYRWYRNGTLLAGESGNSLSVSENGTYFVEVDYGQNCSSATTSNGVTVNVGTASGLAINGSNDVSICSNESYMLEANVNNSSFLYTWYKDGVEIGPATAGDYTHTVDGSTSGFEGNYSVGISGTGICNETSGSVSLKQKGNFSLSIDQGQNITLMPGGNKSLSITTDATSPSIQWYRNNVAISGATDANLTITQIGTYKVEVTAGGSCGLTKTIDNIEVLHPTSFLVTIAAIGGYEECVSANTVLDISEIQAVTSSGNIEVTAEFKPQMTYQWYKDGTAISGATSNSHSVSSFTENGSYHVRAQVSTYDITATAIIVKLAFIEGVQISSPTTVVCSGGDNIIISSDITDTTYTYAWYKDNTDMGVSTSSLQANQPGSYQLRISSNGCTVNSNTLVLSNADESAIQFSENSPVILVEGSTKTITASGGTAYKWYNTNNDLLSSTDAITVSEEGSYKLVASLGDCEVVKILEVSFKENFNVPNVITPNADGINDLWVIPNSYSNKEDIEVVIYNGKGEEVYRTTNYQNNWPESTASFSIKQIIYYYSISKGNETLKRGTITIIQ
ncbi:MAG: gliding motility-associated C-terminal domain-containing protein [Flavobacteriaceae bacterium]|nr:gliding motility-associated C-terminal domain-containing protein [Flavobacteriaceae bacterium]